MKKIVFVLLAICCCGVFLLTGCKKDDTTSTATPTVKTPIQQLNESVWLYRTNTDNALATHWASITDLVTRVGTLETTVSGLTAFDPAPLTARVVALEGLNMSALSAQVSYINLQIADLADDNLSARLSALESRVNTHITATPTPTANVTPTPTVNATPTPVVTKPVAIYPTVGSVIPNGSVMFQWTECNATVYEFWFGDNSNNMTPIDIELYSDTQSFLWAAPNPDTYYFWRIRAISGTTVKSSSFWFKTAP